MRSSLALAALAVSASASDPFVRRQGNRLTVNGQPFRAAGGNIYWAGLDENAENSTESRHVAYPSQFCVKDAFATAALMGANIVRCHTCGVSVGNPLSFEPKLGVFNSTALRSVDLAVAEAGKRGIRLIVPLIDNWHYYHGGKHTFTDWLGLSSEDDFYTAPAAVAAFKAYIKALLDHTNSITGVRYGSDPTVAIWETGNELHYKGGPPPTNWTQDIAAFVKSVAPDHLVMDGTQGVNVPALGLSAVDVYSEHYYPGPSVAIATAAAKTVADAGKVFVVGEFGWKTSSLEPFLAAVEGDENFAADLYWSLFPHRNDFGFVQHGDSYTLHFPDGDGHAAAVAALRAHAFAMSANATAPPPVPAPPAPVVTLINSTSVAWRGSAGGGNYSLAHAPSPSGPWVQFCDACATDDEAPVPMPSGASEASFFRAQAVAADRSSASPWSVPQRGPLA